MAERDKSCPYDWRYAIDYLFSSMAERDKSRPYSLRHDISQNMQRKSLEKNLSQSGVIFCIIANQHYELLVSGKQIIAMNRV